MPKKSGKDYYAAYFDNEAPSRNRNSKRKPKPTSAQVLYFLENSLRSFVHKYGVKPKLILMSKEMKTVVDGRERGKKFLKKINIKTTDKLQGQETIYITERKEVIK